MGRRQCSRAPLGSAPHGAWSAGSSLSRYQAGRPHAAAGATARRVHRRLQRDRPTSPASARRTASASSGESSSSPSPAWTCLQYSRASRGWRSRTGRRRCGRRRAARSRSTGGRTARRRRRSGRASGRRSRRRGAPRRPHARVQPLGDLLDAAVQRRERLLQRARVGDEIVAAGRSEDGALLVAQPAQPDGEHEREDQRDQRDAAGREGGDARGIRQLSTRCSVRVADGRAGTAGAAQPLVKSAWYSDWLLSVFSSPGTGATRTRMVTAAPIGGGSSSGRLAVALAFGAIWSIVSVSVIAIAARALDADRDLDVELVVLAAVGELDRERRRPGRR